MTEFTCDKTDDGLASWSGPAVPMYPRFRSVAVERPYPVTGYCVLTHRPGRLMIPSIVEYRAYCSSDGFRECPWWTHPERAEAGQ
ncbi:MAG TPA: hypothetical protein VLT62_12105 [Candidatus Methylomirabilis sp.]|nr:hypothetical protein [Candidatus Methylomirabilis sp.]